LYRVYFHRGNAEDAKVADHYAEFAGKKRAVQ